MSDETEYRPPETFDPLPEEIQNTEYTVILPNDENQKLTRKRKNELEKGTHRAYKSGSSIERIKPVDSVHPQERENYIDWMTIDIVDLWRMVYEHRRYAAAQGFADSEMQILKAIEFGGRATMSRKMIKEELEKEEIEYSDGTLHEALNNLEEKGLIRKLERGLYSYDGP